MHIKTSSVFGTRNEVKPTKDLVVVVGGNYIGFSQSLLNGLKEDTRLINLSSELYTPSFSNYSSCAKLEELLNSGECRVKYFIHTGSTSDRTAHGEAQRALDLIWRAGKSDRRIIENMIVFDCVELFNNTDTLISTARTPEGGLSKGRDIKQAKQDGLRVAHIFSFKSSRVNTPDVYKEKAFSLVINHFKKPDARNLSLLVGPYGEQEIVGDGEVMPYIGS